MICAVRVSYHHKYHAHTRTAQIRTLKFAAMASISDISKLIESANKKLLASINKVNTDLKTEIQQLSLSVSEKLTKVCKDVDTVQQRCDFLEDLAKRQERRKDLIVRNVPVLKDENVALIVQNICSSVGFQSPYGFPVAFRLRGANESAIVSRVTRSKPDRTKDKSVQFPPILMKFATDWDVKIFMEGYYKASLKLSNVGFNSEDRIYVSENLTPANFAIFRLAREMKKTGTVTKLRVQDGIVAVHITGEKNFIPVKTIQDLEALVLVSDN